MNKIFEKWFGKKIKIVFARKLYAYAEFEQLFIFNGNTEDSVIKKTLWEQKDYSVEHILKQRTHDIEVPTKTQYRPHTKEKLIQYWT